MTRKEKMALKRQVNEHLYHLVNWALREAKLASDVIEFHQAKDKTINKTATDIVNLLAPREATS